MPRTTRNILVSTVSACLLWCSACGTTKAGPAPNVDKHPNLSFGCVTAWAGTIRSPQASLAQAEGGYAWVDATTRDRVRSDTGGEANRYRPIEAITFNALGAAIHDLHPQLRECMAAVDSVGSDLQYVVVLHLVDARKAGMFAESVHVQRIAAMGDDGVPVTTATRSENCIADVLSRVELPPGGGSATVQVVVRYDDCIPASLRAARLP